MAESEVYKVQSSSISNQSETDDYTRSNPVRIIVLYKRRWVVLAIFSLISMSNEVIWISLSSISSVIKGYYNVTYHEVSWLASIFNLCYFLVPLASFFMKKFGLKLTIITGAVLNAIASYFRIGGRSRNGFKYVMVGNGFAALAQCFILFVPSPLAAVWFSDTERAKATSIGVLANMFGVALGFLMGGLLVPNTKDYDDVIKERIFLTLLLQAIVCSILVVVSIIFLKEAPPHPPSMSQYLKRRRRVNKLNANSILENHTARYTDQIISYNIAMETQYSNFEEFQKAMRSVSGEKRKQSTVLDLKVKQSSTRKFLAAARELCKNASFHLILQAFALFSMPFMAISININQWCTLKFPGKDQNVGLMGFVAVICGLIGMPLAGILVDKTHRYKLISMVLLICSAVSLLGFTLVLVYSKSFAAVFVTYCIYGLCSFPYMPVALEHAAEVTYPISEGVSSSILFGTANGYALLGIHITSWILDKKMEDVAGYVLVGVYVAALLCVTFVKGQLKRFDADKSSVNDSNIWKTDVAADDRSSAGNCITNNSVDPTDGSTTHATNANGSHLKLSNGYSPDTSTDHVHPLDKPSDGSI